MSPPTDSHPHRHHKMYPPKFHPSLCLPVTCSPPRLPDTFGHAMIWTRTAHDTRRRKKMRLNWSRSADLDPCFRPPRRVSWSLEASWWPPCPDVVTSSCQSPLVLLDYQTFINGFLLLLFMLLWLLVDECDVIWGFARRMYECSSEWVSESGDWGENGFHGNATLAAC